MPVPVSIVIVAAVARNGVIGSGGALPWRLPADLSRFKSMTMGKPLVMGRKTYESIGRPLPGRETVVVSRDPAFRPEGVTIAASVDEALATAAILALKSGGAEVIVAGGGEIYAQTIGLADRLEITTVEAEPDGDAKFPRIDESVWMRSEIPALRALAKDGPNYSFARYARRA